jgi:enoyl-CoA hydratase
MPMPNDPAHTAFTQILYQTPAPGVVRIVMNRPEKRNAQGVTMTYELDDAFRRACHDDDVRVIILAGAGEHFSAGHDIGGSEPWMPTPEQSRGSWGQYGGSGWEGGYAREKELYLDITERWRNVSKPTIAEIQGAVISGGLMLAWACDLIICSEDARFRDGTGADMDVPGVEFFQPQLEMGVRKAKEWLFTGDWMTAAEAERRGMVNHVVPREELSQSALDLAKRIAAQDRFTLKLIKQSVNHAQDAMGRRQAMDYSFALHQIGHMQNLLVHGSMVNLSRLPESIRRHLEKIQEDLAVVRPERDPG